MNYIQDYEVISALQRIERSMERRIDKHGRAPHTSAHETLGIVTEEMYEVTKAIHENQEPNIIAKELRDLAVAAIWGYISIGREQ